MRLFNTRCCLCGRKNTDQLRLCTACDHYLPRIEPYASPLAIHHFPVLSPFWYKEPLKTLIQDYKFHQKLFLTPILGQLWADFIHDYYKNNNLPRPQAIIPIPLHPKRLQERGYHQVGELAKIMTKTLQCPVDLNVCRRIRHTVPQSTLPVNERKTNIQHAFDASIITQKHIAIIDDVITTGETASVFIQALLQKNSALQIDIWCLARTKH